VPEFQFITCRVMLHEIHVKLAAGVLALSCNNWVIVI